MELVNFNRGIEGIVGADITHDALPSQGKTFVPTGLPIKKHTEALFFNNDSLEGSLLSEFYQLNDESLPTLSTSEYRNIGKEVLASIEYWIENSDHQQESEPLIVNAKTALRSLIADQDLLLANSIALQSV